MDSIYNTTNLEKFIWAAFGLQIGVKSIIVDRIPVGASSAATVFLSDRGLLYAFIATRGGQTLGDVKKILSRMNLRAGQFLPPRANPTYFDDVAAKKFNEVFPSRRKVNDSDLIFYRTLVPYNPALIQVAEIENGVIRQYDSDAVGNWRNSVKFAYRRIITS